MSENYDLIIIGSGPGGYVSAIKAAKLGMKAAIIECLDVGGTCLNRGCVPTKTFIHASQTFKMFETAEHLGISANEITIDLPRMYQYKNEVVEKLRGGVERLLSGNKVTLIRGRAKIESNHCIIVECEQETLTLETEKILIATGSKPLVPSIPGIDLPGVITSDDLLSDYSYCDGSMMIIGGGVIGCEFALVLNAIGCKVTIVEAMSRILPAMDKDISQNLKMILKKRGVEIYTDARVEKIQRSEAGLDCVFHFKDEMHTVTAAYVMAAIGRSSNTDDLFAEGLSVDMERGKILVNESFETSVPGIFAIGDAIKGIQLAHVASAQGIYAVEKMSGLTPEQDLSIVPSCVYTDPEIACVGIMEEYAKKNQMAIRVGKFITTANSKSMIEMQDRGFVKLIFDNDTDKILGAHMMCARATDMIGELALAIANGLTSKQMLKAMKAHPTFSESIAEAVEDSNGEAIHIMPKRR